MNKTFLPLNSFTMAPWFIFLRNTLMENGFLFSGPLPLVRSGVAQISPVLPRLRHVDVRCVWLDLVTLLPNLVRQNSLNLVTLLRRYFVGNVLFRRGALDWPQRVANPPKNRQGGRTVAPARRLPKSMDRVTRNIIYLWSLQLLLRNLITHGHSAFVSRTFTKSSSNAGQNLRLTGRHSTLSRQG